MGVISVRQFCNVGIVLYKPTVVICQPQELLDVAFGDWYWPHFYPFGFFWVSCDARWGDVSEVCDSLLAQPAFGRLKFQSRFSEAGKYFTYVA